MNRATVVLSALALAAAPGTVAAQGFGVYEHGTCTMGRAGTGVAAPCEDGSAVFYNPAALGAAGRGFTISGGVTLIAAGGSFTGDYLGLSTDLTNGPIPVPHGYVTYGINEKLAAGIGLFVPYGLGTQWPDTFDGRFNGYDNDLKTFYVQPTVSYRIHPRVALGAGFDLAIGSVELRQRLDLSTVPVPGFGGLTMGQLGVPFHTQFADADIKATGATGVGGHFGVLVDATDRIHLGARFLLPITIDYDGQATFDPAPTGIVVPAGNPFGVPGGTSLDAVISTFNLFSDGQLLGDQSATTSIPMPAQLTAGVAVDVTPALTVLADYQFVHWGVFDTLAVDFANGATPDLVLVEQYRDSHGARVGFDYRADDRWTVRGGYLYHTGAAPAQTVTPLLPEGARNEVTAGVGVELMPGRLRVDGAYQYIRQNDRRGRVQEVPAGTPVDVVVSDINSGLYRFHAHLFGLTFTAKF